MNLNKACHLIGRTEGDLRWLKADLHAGCLNDEDVSDRIDRLTKQLAQASELIFGDDPDTARSGVDGG